MAKVVLPQFRLCFTASVCKQTRGYRTALFVFDAKVNPIQLRSVNTSVRTAPRHDLKCGECNNRVLKLQFSWFWTLPSRLHAACLACRSVGWSVVAVVGTHICLHIPSVPGDVQPVVVASSSGSDLRNIGFFFGIFPKISSGIPPEASSELFREFFSKIFRIPFRNFCWNS